MGIRGVSWGIPRGTMVHQEVLGAFKVVPRDSGRIQGRGFGGNQGVSGAF